MIKLNELINLLYKKASLEEISAKVSYFLENDEISIFKIDLLVEEFLSILYEALVDKYNKYKRLDDELPTLDLPNLTEYSNPRRYIEYFGLLKDWFSKPIKNNEPNEYLANIASALIQITNIHKESKKLGNEQKVLKELLVSMDEFFDCLTNEIYTELDPENLIKTDIDEFEETHDPKNEYKLLTPKELVKKQREGLHCVCLVRASYFRMLVMYVGDFQTCKYKAHNVADSIKTNYVGNVDSVANLQVGDVCVLHIEKCTNSDFQRSRKKVIEKSKKYGLYFNAEYKFFPNNNYGTKFKQGDLINFNMFEMNTDRMLVFDNELNNLEYWYLDSTKEDLIDSESE